MVWFHSRVYTLTLIPWQEVGTRELGYDYGQPFDINSLPWVKILDTWKSLSHRVTTSQEGPLRSIWEGRGCCRDCGLNSWPHTVLSQFCALFIFRRPQAGRINYTPKSKSSQISRAILPSFPCTSRCSGIGTVNAKYILKWNSKHTHKPN